MMRRSVFAWMGMLMAGLAVGGGCLERQETIRVDRDGSVTYDIRYEGDKSDFRTKDALPSLASGWDVQWSDVEGKNDERRLSATRKFAPGTELPATFAAPTDPDAELALKFPTSIRVEQRADWTYYHFRREYTPRDWERVHFWQKFYLESPDIKKLADVPPDQLTADDQKKFVDAFVSVEARTQMEYAQMAMREATLETPQDVWLTARAAILSVYDGFDASAVITRQAGLTDEQRTQLFDSESRRLRDDARNAFDAALRKSGRIDEPQIAAIHVAFDRIHRQYEITEQTGGHLFSVNVKLPGELVAHNGDKVENGGVVWEFNGEFFRDRPLEMLATSRVAK